MALIEQPKDGYSRLASKSNCQSEPNKRKPCHLYSKYRDYRTYCTHCVFMRSIVLVARRNFSNSVRKANTVPGNTVRQIEMGNIGRLWLYLLRAPPSAHVWKADSLATQVHSCPDRDFTYPGDVHKAQHIICSPDLS